MPQSGPTPSFFSGACPGKVAGSAMTLQPGVLVTPNVQLVRKLGQGGMGSVWIARHKTLNIDVAVKFISEELASANAELVERFQREASIAAQVKSPHVVQTFDQGFMADGTPFIVMELLDGESLGARLARAPLTLEEATSVLSQVADVLSCAHELGVVHRDLKPDNIFLINSGYELFAKVLDFGIAKQCDLSVQPMTQTGAMVGTPMYMSPEQVVSARDVDHHADLWALAVVLYEALTGTMPFNGETLGALCVAISDAEFVPPTQIRPELHEGLDAFFAVALAHQPADRYGSGGEMAAAFVELTQGSAKRASLEPRLRHRATPAPYSGATLPPESIPEYVTSGQGQRASETVALESLTVEAQSKLTHEPVVRGAELPLRRTNFALPFAALVVLVGLGVAWSFSGGARSTDAAAPVEASKPEPEPTEPGATTASARVQAAAIASAEPVESAKPAPPAPTAPNVTRGPKKPATAASTSVQSPRGADDCLVWDGSKWVPKPSCLGKK